mgnify:FL=1
MIRQIALGTMLGAVALASPVTAGQSVLKNAPNPATATGASDGLVSGVEPIGNPGDWFPPESYPPDARIASQEGRTEFSLDIDAAGRITGCNIIGSSGSDLLDSTTCSQLILNGSFKPARDRNGKPMPGKWNSAMRWQLSDADAAGQ